MARPRYEHPELRGSGRHPPASPRVSKDGRPLASDRVRSPEEIRQDEVRAVVRNPGNRKPPKVSLARVSIQENTHED